MRALGEGRRTGGLGRISRRTASLRRSPHPRMALASRIRPGWRCRKATPTARASSSSRKRCSGTKRSRAMRTSRAGPARKLRSQSASGPHPETDHDLARVAVVSEDHRHHVVRLTGLATDVYQHEERAAQHPAFVAVIQPQRGPENRQRQPSRHAAKPEPGPVPIPSGRRRNTRSHGVTARSWGTTAAAATTRGQLPGMGPAT